MNTKCSRCGGQDSGCYVCRPETENKPWPTREEIEELHQQTQIVLNNYCSDFQGVRASACIAEDGQLVFIGSGNNYGIGTFLSGSGKTPEEAIDVLQGHADRADPTTRLKADAEKLGFTLTKIAP